MSRRTVLWVAAILSLALLGQPLNGAESVSLGKLAKRGLRYGQLLQELASLLEDATRKKGTSRSRLADKEKVETIELAVVTRQTVEVESDFGNEVLGIMMPGRRVSCQVRVEIEVRTSFDCRRVRIEVDPDYPDTVTVVLPQPRLTADFVEGADAEYRVDYGWLRSKWLDSEAAAEFRRQLYAEAKAKALQKRRRDQAALPLRELQRDLRKRFPGQRIYLRLESPDESKGK